GIDLDLQVDARRLGFSRDDLHHLVAHIALATGKLVGCAQYDGRREGAAADRGDDQRSESHHDCLLRALLTTASLIGWLVLKVQRAAIVSGEWISVSRYGNRSKCPTRRQPRRAPRNT